MDGAWHLYRIGERWKAPGRNAWLVLESGDWQAVNFGGPILELHRTESLQRDERLTTLGPDILVEPFDDAEYVRRMRRNDSREIGDAVMQQRIVAGIGNIYKNESLFMTGIDPWRRVSTLADDDLVRIRTQATIIMHDGVLDARTITFKGPGPAGKWVYGRGGDACRRCSSRIESALQGDDQRITWWCPYCQT
jgi:endonuclease-8